MSEINRVFVCRTPLSETVCQVKISLFYFLLIRFKEKRKTKKQNKQFILEGKREA